MIYQNTKPGKFISRPNRFIAYIEIDGEERLCHVKNTGRCKELLIPGSKVIVQEKNDIGRKTNCDLISVYKGDRLINIDSHAPNCAFEEFLPKIFSGLSIVRPEFRYKNSRFDFYAEREGKKMLIEVKGVTLEENNIALFPDAPTLRGVKHITELQNSLDDGYEAYVVFVIQMQGVLHFSPNTKMHKEFAAALKSARERGVRILAFDCAVTENSMSIKDSVSVVLS